MTKKSTKARRKPARGARARKAAPTPVTASEGGGKPRSREGTKQEKLIALLRRPGGATIAEAMAGTGWQAHSIRGTIAGGLKKKLGLKVDSTKVEDRGRVYRIAD